MYGSVMGIVRLDNLAERYVINYMGGDVLEIPVKNGVNFVGRTQATVECCSGK